MKKHFIWLLLALTAAIFVSCDDEDSLDAAGGIIESIESGEMMYKLDYIGSDITASDEYALYSYSETWDRRPIALVNNDAYIYDLNAGEFSHIPRSIEDELYRYSLSGTWFSLADGGYVVSCNRILLSELEEAAENISFERGFVKLYDGVIERYYPSPAEFPTVYNEYDQFLCDADGYFYLFSGSEQSYSVYSPDLEFMYTLDAPENILDLQYLKRYDGEVYLVHAGNILDGERALYLRSFDHETRGWSSLNDSKTIPTSLVESEGGGVSEVIFGGGLEYEKLARFDIFADLYGFMDGESAPDGFSSDDLLPCVREPFETADRSYASDGDIMAIIYEEAQYYFNVSSIRIITM